MSKAKNINIPRRRARNSGARGLLRSPRESNAGSVPSSAAIIPFNKFLSKKDQLTLVQRDIEDPRVKKFRVRRLRHASNRDQQQGFLVVGVTSLAMLDDERRVIFVHPYKHLTDYRVEGLFCYSLRAGKRLVDYQFHIECLEDGSECTTHQVIRAIDQRVLRIDSVMDSATTREPVSPTALQPSTDPRARMLRQKTEPIFFKKPLRLSGRQPQVRTNAIPRSPSVGSGSSKLHLSSSDLQGLELRNFLPENIESVSTEVPDGDRFHCKRAGKNTMVVITDDFLVVIQPSLGTANFSYSAIYSVLVLGKYAIIKFKDDEVPLELQCTDKESSARFVRFLGQHLERRSRIIEHCENSSSSESDEEPRAAPRKWSRSLIDPNQSEDDNSLQWASDEDSLEDFLFIDYI